MTNTITALQQQKRNPERVNVYLNGEYAFGVASIVAAWLQVGQELSAEKIEALQAEDSVESAYQRALHYLSFRPRSEAEVERNLQKHAIPEPIIGAVMARLKEKRLADDTAFAAAWVENRNTFRPRGAYALRAELRQKDVPDAIIDQALISLDEEALAQSAAEQKARQLAGRDWPVFRKKLSDHLARRGFGHEIVAQACRKAWQQLHGSQPAKEF